MIQDPECGKLVQHMRNGKIGRIVALSVDEDGRIRAHMVWLRKHKYQSTSILVDYLRDWYRNPNWPDNSGAFTNADCPECGKLVVRNGNYFCEDFGYDHPARNGKPAWRSGGPCNWALPHPASRPVDRAVCDALGINYR